MKPKIRWSKQGMINWLLKILGKKGKLVPRKCRCGRRAWEHFEGDLHGSRLYSFFCKFCEKERLKRVNRMDAIEAWNYKENKWNLNQKIGISSATVRDVIILYMTVWRICLPFVNQTKCTTMGRGKTFPRIRICLHVRPVSKCWQGQKHPFSNWTIKSKLYIKRYNHYSVL